MAGTAVISNATLERRWCGFACRLARSALIVAAGALLAASAMSAQDASVPSEPQAAKLFARAAQLVQQQNLSAAVEIYEQILQSDPDSLEALNSLGVIDAHLGKYREAAAAYDRALRLKPGSFPLWLNLGLAYFKGREFALAVKPFERAAALNPASFQAAALLAMSYFWSGEYSAAAARLERLNAARPGNQALEYLLAQSYLQTGRYQKLLAFVEDPSEKPFAPAAADVLRGEANAGLNRTAQAIDDFKAAAVASPGQTGVHFGLGLLYWEQHRDRDAEAQFWLEMEGGGLISESEAYLGRIALAQGKPRRARAFFEQALRLSPKPSLAWYGLGVLDLHARHYAAAESELKSALQNDPRSGEAHAALAQVYRAQGKTRLAAKEVEAARRLPPKDVAERLRSIPALPPS